MYEAWNTVLMSAKEKFGIKSVRVPRLKYARPVRLLRLLAVLQIMTPQMLLDMIEQARLRIEQLEKKQVCSDVGLFTPYIHLDVLCCSPRYKKSMVRLPARMLTDTRYATLRN